MQLGKICCSLKSLETIELKCFYNLKTSEEDIDQTMTLVAK